MRRSHQQADTRTWMKFTTIMLSKRIEAQNNPYDVLMYKKL